MKIWSSGLVQPISLVLRPLFIIWAFMAWNYFFLVFGEINKFQFSIFDTEPNSLIEFSATNTGNNEYIGWVPFTGGDEVFRKKIFRTDP